MLRFVSGRCSGYLLCERLIAVLGMSVLTGFTRLFSFGNAGFMSIGAYAAAICSVQFKFPFVLSILIGAAIAGIISLYSRQS
ncbi:MAG: ABC transporter permease subunit [Lachnospiraceae bacterium]